MSQFPAEIYGQIATELSKQDLFSLSLVSRRTVYEANRLLYRNVDFSSLPVDVFARDPTLRRQQDHPINVFFRTISNSHTLASLVEAFAFRTPYHPEADVDPCHALSSMHNIRSLSVSSILSSDCFPSYLHACSQNLLFFTAEFPLDLELVKFLTFRPNIRQLSIGRDKVPASVEPRSLSNQLTILPSLTKLSVVEGAVGLAEYCYSSSLTHLDIQMSERQPVTLVLSALNSIGPQLRSLKWHQSLYYGNGSIVQCLPSLAELTPNLQHLQLSEHFCGGWGNPPCTQYVAEVAAMDLAGQYWTCLESIEWKSHLSTHEHLVYWDGPPLCDRAFASLPALCSMSYTEESRIESDSRLLLLYNRRPCGSVEKKEIWQEKL